MSTHSDTFAIEVNNLHFSYPDGQAALKGVNLRIKPGEKVAIIGPNGAGKSTLLLHLNGLLRGKGDIKIMGREIGNSNGRVLEEVRALVGLVFQDPEDQLFSPTVYEDIAFGPTYMGLSHDEVAVRVGEALRNVRLECYGDRMPHHLSRGEKKRAAIATVLSMRPEILALDEPSADLDPRSRRELIRLLGTLRQTIVITTHDMHMVKEAFPRTFIMDEGVVVVDSDTESILSDQALLEAHGLELP